jgi:hypothetical protein
MIMVVLQLQQVQSHLGMMMTKSMRSVFWLDRWRLFENAAKIRMTRNQMILHTIALRTCKSYFVLTVLHSISTKDSFSLR